MLVGSGLGGASVPSGLTLGGSYVSHMTRMLSPPLRGGEGGRGPGGQVEVGLKPATRQCAGHEPVPSPSPRAGRFKGW